MPLDTLRRRLAREAARLLYHGHAADYRDAKTRALRALGLSAKGRAALLPANPEVRLELEALVELHEGDARAAGLADLRRLALAVMTALEPFAPRLVGSVLTGAVRRDSDVNLEAFADEPAPVLAALHRAGYAPRVDGPAGSGTGAALAARPGGRASRGGKAASGRGRRAPLCRVRLALAADVEVAVRPVADRRRARRSPITGRELPFAELPALRTMVARDSGDEVPDLWEHFP